MRHGVKFTVADVTDRCFKLIVGKVELILVPIRNTVQSALRQIFACTERDIADIDLAIRLQARQQSFDKYRFLCIRQMVQRISADDRIIMAAGNRFRQTFSDVRLQETCFRPLLPAR